MRFSFLFILILISLISCNNRSEASKKANTETIKNLNQSIKDSTEYKSINRPTKYFILLINELKKDNWSHDSLRLKKVAGYNLSSDDLFFFENIPFYKLRYDNSVFKKLNNRRFLKNYDDVDSTEILLFNKVENIWRYYYRKNIQERLIPDGVIEQWEFKNRQSALASKKVLDKIFPEPYFNTNPYHIVIDNFLFIFHTRAMAFSYEQKEHYEKFQKLIEQ